MDPTPQKAAVADGQPGDPGTTERVHEENMHAGRRLRVGDLARLTGKTVRALHLYEELGLLHPAERSKGGYRLYDPEAVERVAWIAKLQAVGFSLAEVQDFARSLERSQTAPLAMLKVRRVFEQKLVQTRAQLTELHTLERDLELGLAYLEGCHWCDPSELPESCSECAKHHETPPAILVTGMQHT
jgi:MerR family copper efflux transcriptional regulator